MGKKTNENNEYYDYKQTEQTTELTIDFDDSL